MRFLFVSLVLVAGIVAAQPPADYVEGEVIVTYKAAQNLAARQRVGQRTRLIRAPGRTTKELIAELKQDPTVETVEPNYLRWFSVAAPTNDPSFAQLWGLHNTGQTVAGTAGQAGADIRFVEAWRLVAPGTGPVVVAVIDSGIDSTHPDLVSNLWTNAGEIPGNSTDDDGNGYVDDYIGYDFVNGLPNPTDSGLHGTHVSGTLAATGNNQVGVIGVNFQARIMALKISPNGINVTAAAAIEAIEYATMMKGRGVNIVAINASFGGSSFSTAERAAIQAAGEAGIIFCAAAGNESRNNDVTPEYPASYRLPNMIVVAASDQNDVLADFSNFGATTVDLAAPGVNILSTVPVALAGTTATVVQASVTLAGNGLTYAGTTTGITAAVVDCGLGYPTNFPPTVAGNIALIQRGTLFFTEKVGNAMAAGATAAIIYNNTNGNFLGSLQSPSNWIPAVALSQADGQTLLGLLPTPVTVINVTDPTQIYQYLDGTSMATPHVAGAVAFAAQNYPGETVAVRIQRILAGTAAVTGLQSKVATGGRLNLQHVFTGTPAPVLSNVVAEIAGITVVLPNRPTVFTSAITNFVGASPNCLWNFGDGATSSDCGPTHVYTACGPQTVTSVVTDGVVPVSNSFAVAVACPLDSVSVSLKVNFLPGKLDSTKLKAMIELPANFNVNTALVQLDIGSVAVPFTLDAKGTGVNGASKLKLKAKGSQLWQVSATLKGDWGASWVADGLVNATTNAPVAVPVLLFVNGATPAAFYTDKTLQYKATAGKSGAAK
ncbi:MAG: S8 family serine peptidase [Verrucomicrobiota bacterium]